MGKNKQHAFAFGIDTKNYVIKLFTTYCLKFTNKFLIKNPFCWSFKIFSSGKN